MVRRTWVIALGVAGLTAMAWGQEAKPVRFMLQPQNPPSVYALPAPPTEEDGYNAGGVHLDMQVRYLSDYLYRGVDRTAFLEDATGAETGANANFQFDGTLFFDLGKLPHPFVGIFANVLDDDPVTNFQEVRPYFGAEWRVRPLILAAGNNAYVFPDRSEVNTAEVWGQITLDDSAILYTDEPLLSPYIYGAYDYDAYNGWYLEAGVSHDFVFEEVSTTITTLANVGYVIGNAAFAGPDGEDTGFQHYELGLIGKYNLNTLLNIPRRYGQWSINGYLYYSDGIDKDLRADTQLWGGAGIELEY